MSAATLREIDAPPYRLAINIQPKYRVGSLGEIHGYIARCMVMRLDGTPVYEDCVYYQIFDGELFFDMAVSKLKCNRELVNGS
jgi:hypothetical protein